VLYRISGTATKANPAFAGGYTSCQRRRSGDLLHRLQEFAYGATLAIRIKLEDQAALFLPVIGQPRIYG